MAFIRLSSASGILGKVRHFGSDEPAPCAGLRPARRRSRLSFAVLLSGVALLACGAAAAQVASDAAAADERVGAAGGGAAGGVEIQLIAFNDLHGHLDAAVPPAGSRKVDPKAAARAPSPGGGIAYLAGEIAELEARHPRSIVVGAGDLIGASPLDSGLFHDEPTIEALNALGLEYSAVGNHELDDGRAELLRMQRGGCDPAGTRGKDTCLDGPFRGARFSYLAANVIDTRTGRPLLPAYAIKRVDLPGGGWVRIAFIGLVLRGTAELVGAGAVAGLRFEDEADTVNALLPRLHDAGADAVIVLIHQGAERSGGGAGFDGCNGVHGPIVGIVRRLDPSVSAVISGHTHKAYVCRLPSRDPGRLILTTQAGSYGRYVTDVLLRVGPEQRGTTVVSAHNLPVGGGAAGARPVPAIARLVDRYDAAASPLARRVVGRIRAPLSRSPSRAGELPLGDVVADAQLAATAGPADGGAEIAFMNPGGLREDLWPGPEGEVTYGELFAVQPFGNHLVTLDLTGRQILRLLEQQWRSWGRGPMLQVSTGFEYAWTAAPRSGRHVVSGSVRVGGAPIVPERHYRVTVSDFLAGGGNGFSVLAEGAVVDAGGADIDALVAYLAGHSPLAPPPGGRIRRSDGD